jgi:exopolyphosphatase/guanosine-5'-triphosphate,3'-diphosphate pyrophosphatase
MHARLDPEIESVELSVRSRIEIDISAKLLSIHPTLAYWLSKEKIAWEEVGRQFVVKSSS